MGKGSIVQYITVTYLKMAEGGIDDESLPFLPFLAKQVDKEDPYGEISMELAEISEIDPTSKKEVNIALVGKYGSGKSTLARNILGLPRVVELCASHINNKCDTQETTWNGITIKVIDTVGLENRKQKKELRKLCKHTKGKADLIIYCLPVNPGAKFDDGNPAIMKSLQNAYGNDIWKQCLLVFTFSNTIVERLKKDKSIKDEEAVEKYKKLLTEHATKFTGQLRKMKAKNTIVQQVYGCQTEARRDDDMTIIAIPVGDEPDDPVFPDFRPPTKFTIPTSTLVEQSVQIDITDWRDILFVEIIRKCSSPEMKKYLLQYRYGRNVALSIAKAAGGATGGGAGGLAGGAAVGAGVGAIAGLLGGPVGVVPGAAIGAAIGGAVGGLGGGVGGGTAILRKKTKKP
jgi:energy-coupling factor transporter ATP-binding protein EcfA2